jgi:arginase
VGRMTRINAVPQWQGAVNERARLMPEACLGLAGLAGRVLDRPVHRIDQSAATSARVGGIANRDVLTGANRAAQVAAVAGVAEPVLTIGGDCGVELVPIAAARASYGAGLRVVWFDAHPDLNTPGSSPSGAFHGMVLRSLLGEGDPELAGSPPLTAGRVALVGARAIDDGEREVIARGLVTTDLAAALEGAEHVYVHVDLDVLDPEQVFGLNYPEPGGLSVDELVAALDALANHTVVGAGLTECVGTAEETHVLEPVLAALGRLLG